jgi:hypothetical protein
VLDANRVLREPGVLLYGHRRSLGAMDDPPRLAARVRYRERSVPVCLIRPDCSPLLSIAYLLVLEEEVPPLVRMVLAETGGEGVQMLANPSVLVPQLLAPVKPQG